jgi:hypothetical protein
MASMHRIDEAERRRRLAVRHRLGPRNGAGADAAAEPLNAAPGRAGSPADVARSLVALHATDPATVYLSIRARMAASVTPATIEDSLYERRDLVRMLAMRRTVFVVPAEAVPVVQASTTDRIGRDQRARLVKLLGQTGTVPDPEPWLADVERSVLRLLADMGGTATAAELSAAEPRLKTTLLMAPGKPYEATQTITSRVLLVISAQGQIVRGRPIGSWLSQQYRWSLTEHWLASRGGAGQGGAGRGGAGEGGAGQGGAVSEGDARTELARQWLATFGPAPVSDLKWWTGWTVTQVRQTLAGLGAVEVDLGGTVGVALPDDLESTADPGDWAALLPGLDPTVMGWSDRSWFLGPHAPALFDGTGNAGPTVWLNGRVIGGWAQRGDGEIAVRLLQDVGADAAGLVEAEAEQVGAWLSGVRVIPRFRTPVERGLSA